MKGNEKDIEFSSKVDILKGMNDVELEGFFATYEARISNRLEEIRQSDISEEQLEITNLAYELLFTLIKKYRIINAILIIDVPKAGEHPIDFDNYSTITVGGMSSSHISGIIDQLEEMLPPNERMLRQLRSIIPTNFKGF